MNSIIVISVLSMVLCFALLVWSIHKTSKIMDTLDEMLDTAINDSFTENTYDESKLSHIEAKLNRFLTLSLSSRKRVAAEKVRIKALISDISHQTKTPIANILLYTELLQEQEDLPESCRPLTEQIDRQAEKLNFLIQSLIKTSRLETGIVRVVPGSNTIVKLLETAVKECEKKAEQKGICIDLNVSHQLTALFDMKWTAEAVYNILDNAVKYSPQSSTINVNAVNYEMFCRIDIKDQGIGISEEDLPRVFQRFYRSRAVNLYEGVGIGLHLAREIITAQGGYIKVKSHIGKGSTFSVFLPAG